MAEGTREPIRTTRIEVVDSKDRVRVIVGTFARGDGETVGVSVLDSHGVERLFLLTDETDASAGVTNTDNNVAGVMVREGDGAYLYAAAPNGTVVQSLDSKADPR